MTEGPYVSSPCTAWLAHCAAPTSLCPLLPQCLPAVGSTSPPPLSLGMSPAHWGGRGSAPGCPFTCDDQADLTIHLRTQPPARPRRDPSLPHSTASLQQAGAPVHLFTCRELLLHLKPLCPVLVPSEYWDSGVRKEACEERLPWL